MSRSRASAYRCRGCDNDLASEEFRIKPCGERCRICLRCEERMAQRNAERGAEQSNDAHQGERLCAVCYGQSWRVGGIMCRRCGLRYAPEPPIQIDAMARKPHPLACVLTV